jgi:hypothetical protein
LEDRLQPLDGSQLLALDLMIFAYSSWLNSSEDIMADVKNMSLNTEIENIELEFVAPVRQMARVVSWRLPDVKKRVVAIRGSSSANDWLLNLDTWRMIKLIKPPGMILFCTTTRATDGLAILINVVDHLAP